MTGRGVAADQFARDWPVAHVIAPTVRLLSHYFRASVSGADDIPRDRPVIYVGKHPRTYLYVETMLLGLYAFWDSGRPPFRVLEQTGTMLHRVPLLSWVRRRLSPVPASAAHALRALDHGESVLIFPGGSRELYGPRDQLQWRGRTGFARLAIRAGVPVVPFAIAGADRQHPWRIPMRGASLWLPPVPLPVRLDFRFGRPMAPPAVTPAGRARAVEEFAAAVEAATRELLERPRADRRGGRRRAPAPPGTSHASRPAAGPSRPGRPATDVGAVDLDPRRWRYRFGYLRLASWLSRYHRVRVEGGPPRGPCIYVAHHGAGYLNGDLVVAVYQLAWRDAFERGGPLTPLRVVASKGHALERALPGLAWLKRHAGLIDPSEASCLAALARGEQLLITPGGRRESGPGARDYHLHWNDRYGFVRLALRTGAPIVPLAVVGGYAAYPGFAAGRLSFWSPLPLPARIDIAVGEPVAVPARPGAAHDLAVLRPLQQQIRDRTQALYDRLVARRAR
jgi:1-acyl-sn-glycerol-3-phosphate acyltransferase